jgi:hypothetical protein
MTILLVVVVLSFFALLAIDTIVAYATTTTTTTTTATEQPKPGTFIVITFENGTTKVVRSSSTNVLHVTGGILSLIRW